MTVSLEVELKFLVHGDAWHPPTRIAIGQGNLDQYKQRTIQVKIAGNQVF